MKVQQLNKMHTSLQPSDVCVSRADCTTRLPQEVDRCGDHRPRLPLLRQPGHLARQPPGPLPALQEVQVSPGFCLGDVE